MLGSPNKNLVEPAPQVCQFSVVHDPTDARIFERQIRALVKANLLVAYISKGQLTEGLCGCTHFSLGHAGSNPMRRIGMQVRGWRLALRLGARVIILQDPELLVIGVLVQSVSRRRQVIFDCHEDYAQKLREKSTNPPIGWVLSRLFSIVVAVFGVVGGHFLAPTHHIVTKLGRQRTTLMRNLPSNYMKEQLARCLAAREDAGEHLARSRGAAAAVTFVYAGMISAERAPSVWVDCLLQDPASSGNRILLAGPYASNARQWLRATSESGPVAYLGNLSMARLAQVLTKADVGVVILPPTLTYKLAQPSKLFEYLLSGLPVVISDFDEWRKVVNSCSGVAFYCDPSDPASITSAMRAAANFAAGDSVRERSERARCAAALISGESEASVFTQLVGGYASHP